MRNLAASRASCNPDSNRPTPAPKYGSDTPYSERLGAPRPDLTTRWPTPRVAVRPESRSDDTPYSQRLGALSPDLARRMADLVAQAESNRLQQQGYALARAMSRR